MSTKIDNRLLVNTLLLLLTFFVLFNLFLTFNMSQTLSERLRLEKLASVPPAFEMVVLKDDSCFDCFNVTPVVDQINSMKVNVTSFKSVPYNQEEGSALVTKYSVKHVPSVLLIGAPEKFTLTGFERVDDALVLKEVRPIYIEAATGKQRGRVNITIITAAACKDCFDVVPLVKQLKALVALRGETRLDVSSVAAKKLIKEYNITTVPALILSKDAGEYKAITDEWPKVGTIESDGVFVVRKIPPPYVEVATGSVKGMVSVTYLEDASCKECYNVTLHRGVLAQVGIAPEKESTVDVSSVAGKALVSKYHIEAVPTIIISSDAKEFEIFTSVWLQVGSEEDDGSYVFRNIDAIGGIAYKNMTSGRVMNATQDQA